MNRSILFYGAIAVGVIFSLLGVYYLIHGIYHPYVILSQPFTLINHPPVNYNAHKKFSAIFFAVAALCFLGAYFARPRKAFAR
jgi:predicted transporter